MLELLFSFRGQIGRLKYFLTSLGLGLAMPVFMLGLSLTMAAGHANARPDLGTALLLGLLSLVMLPVFFWSALALQAKRIRDIGFDPVLVIPGFMILSTVNFLAVLAWPHLAPPLVLLGFALNGGFVGCLWFWPGQSGGDSASPTPRSEAPANTVTAQSSPPKAQPQPSAAAWGAGPAPTGFGRRGL